MCVGRHPPLLLAPPERSAAPTRWLPQPQPPQALLLLTASSTVKNTLPPMPIHITRGCQPLGRRKQQETGRQ